jgi:hypothetical protein
MVLKGEGVGPTFDPDADAFQPFSPGLGLDDGKHRFPDCTTRTPDSSIPSVTRFRSISIVLALLIVRRRSNGQTERPPLYARQRAETDKDDPDDGDV